jgi:hypothetical protein
MAALYMQGDQGRTWTEISSGAKKFRHYRKKFIIIIQINNKQYMELRLIQHVYKKKTNKQENSY